MSDTISETCRCGASTTVPVIGYDTMNTGRVLRQSGLAEARAAVADWRENHRCVEPKSADPARESRPQVDDKGSARTERAPQWDFDLRPPVRLGFRPNEEA